jgi:chromosome segregation ATPase
MATVLDTRRISRRLREADVPDAQADAIVDAILEVRDRDLSALATKADLAELRADLQADIAAVRSEMATKVELAALRTEFRAEIGSVRAEVGSVRAEVGSVRAEVAALRKDMGDMRADTLKWTVGLLVAQTGIVAALIRFL